LTIVTQSCTVHQRRPLPSCNVYAELFGSCDDVATETNSYGARSKVTSLAARRTLGDSQAGRSCFQRATHGDNSVLEQSNL